MKTIVSLTLSLSLLSTAFVSAQSRFGFSITAAPTYSYANSTKTVYLSAMFVPTAPAGSTDPVPVTWSNQNHAWGYVVGGMLHYRFSPKWSVSTGLWYNYSKTGGLDPLPYAINPVQISGHGLQIPLFANYRLTTKRLSPYFSAGGLANFRQHTLAQYAPGSGLGTIDFISRGEVAYQTVVGAGIAYRFTPHLSLIAQPMLIWNFRPKGDFSHYTAYQINAQTQLVYSF